MYFARLIPLQVDLERTSVLLLGPRRTGKSALIRNEIKADRVYDLLKSDVFQRLSFRPATIREALRPSDRLIVIDEVQKLPMLMDEVHAMIEEFGVRFLLTGSSARKLRRTHTSLMAGRARQRRLWPFVSAELPGFQLDKALQFGMLPPVCLSQAPVIELEGYAGLYLQEEILAEAYARKIEGFSRFLGRAAMSSGEVINFESIASDAQVPARTVREYYALLEDTLVGTMVAPTSSTNARKVVSKGKFYFFDVGVARALRDPIALRAPTLPSMELGWALEHLLFQELRAYLSYFPDGRQLEFWRTYSGQEVDFVIGDTAIEVKATRSVTRRDLRGLRALAKDRALRRQLVVCREPERRVVEDVEIWPVGPFLAALWQHAILGD